MQPDASRWDRPADPPAPDLTIDPANARMPDGSPARMTARGFGWTEASLRAVLDAFRRRFGRGPTDMGRLLAWKDLVFCQKMFAKIGAQNPGLSQGVVAERAARATSFGRHRVAIGYGGISVQYGSLGDVVLDTGEVLTNVPKWVEVTARPTTGAPVPTGPVSPLGNSFGVGKAQVSLLRGRAPDQECPEIPPWRLRPLRGSEVVEGLAGQRCLARSA